MRYHHSSFDHGRPSRFFFAAHRTIFMLVVLMFVVIIGLIIAQVSGVRPGVVTHECVLPNTQQRVSGVASMDQHGWSVWMPDGRVIQGQGFIQCELILFRRR